MSDEKKPKATFGDVMLGIPAGRGEEQADKAEGEKKPPAEKKVPMVVVRRAGGMVETRSLEVKTVEPTAPAAENGAAEAAPAAPRPELKPVVPTARRSPTRCTSRRPSPRCSSSR